jgi:DNA modification methylase
MRRTNLKLVESVVYYQEEAALWSEDGASSSHSVHNLISLPDVSRSEFAHFFIDRYSNPGDVVLDPFCGSGTVPLEALIRGRLAYASDANPLALIATDAKLDPADITEVTLFLQMINLRKPVNVNLFRQSFAAHYDLNTYRELVYLKAALSLSSDRISQSVKALALSLLHGHTAAYFSAYTSPQSALSPDDQETLNIKRRQSPDYRAVVPRILRKAALALRDGVTTSMKKARSKAHTALSDARDLKYLASSSVHLVLSSPPVPQGHDSLEEMWLKNWFAGLSNEGLRSRLYPSEDTSPDVCERWLEFMGEVILEMARVVIPGGRVVLNLPETSFVRKNQLHEKLLQFVQEAFSRYFDAECLLTNLGKDLHKTDRAEGARRNDRVISNRVVVLRRR